MKQEIIAILNNKDKKSQSKKEILQQLNKMLQVNTDVLEITLEDMQKEGILYYNEKTEKYILFKNTNLARGVLTIDKNGNGIVKIDDEKNILIPKGYLKHADYKDNVIVEYDNQNEIWKVIKYEKDKTDYVGEVYKERNKYYVHSSKRRFDKEITNCEELNIIEGHTVLVKQNIDDETVEVTKIIGHINEPGMDIKTLLCEEGFDPEFKEEVKKEILSIKTRLTEQDIEEYLSNGIEDLRDDEFITMDCDDTKDIDDGILVKKLPNGNYKLKVYIADVSEYVKENSAIDITAREKGTSVYPPGCVSPMLPYELSNIICSLNENSNRLVMCYEMEIDRNGNVKKLKIHEGIGRSRKKMTYGEVNKILEENEIISGYEDYLEMLKNMAELSNILDKKFENNGSLDFYSKELKIILDKMHFPIKLETREQKTAEKIIENFMLITNETVTKYLEYHDFPCNYRVDGDPNQEKIFQAVNLLKIRGYINNSDTKKKYSREDIQKFLNIIRITPAAAVLNKIFIRFMDKAEYSPNNIGHYPLNFNTYGQHTSPIRRYPDLQNQRIIKYSLRHTAEETRQKFGNLDTLCAHLSKREVKAKELEREATKMKAAEYMTNFIGDIQNGIVSGVTECGIWVTLDNGIEGFIHTRRLPNDKYKCSIENYTLYGTKNQNNYTVGDRIKVKIYNANKENRTIDFATIPELALNDMQSNTYRYEQVELNKKLPKREKKLIKRKTKNNKEY